MEYKTLIGFAVGAGIGAAAVYYILKNSFSENSEKEIEEIREYYKEKLEESSSMMGASKDLYNFALDCCDSLDNSKSDKKNVENFVKNNYDTTSKSEEDVNYVRAPYTISPDEYNESSYEKRHFTYFNRDEILVDEKDRKVDIMSTVGLENLEYFGEFEEGMVYVRNDKTKTDFEVSQDVRLYEEVIGD